MNVCRCENISDFRLVTVVYMCVCVYSVRFILVCALTVLLPFRWPCCIATIDKVQFCYVNNCSTLHKMFASSFRHVIYLSQLIWFSWMLKVFRLVVCCWFSPSAIQLLSFIAISSDLHCCFCNTYEFRFFPYSAFALCFAFTTIHHRSRLK